MTDEARAAFRSALADLIKSPVDELRAETALGPTLAGSLGKARIASVLRQHLGRAVRIPPSVITVGDLEAAFFNGAVPNVRATVPQVFSTAGDSLTTCGIDLEEVAALPPAADYWEDPFYKEHFAPAEIAYCAAQAQPAMHFSARWCAKEALKKCDSNLMPASPAAIELAARPSGEMGLRIVGGAWLPVAVSVSHTPTMAAAVVVRCAEPAATSPSVRSSAAPANNFNLAPIVLALIAAILAIIALWRTLLI